MTNMATGSQGSPDLDTVTFGINNTSASIYARNIKNSFEGIEMETDQW